MLEYGYMVNEKLKKVFAGIEKKIKKEQKQNEQLFEAMKLRFPKPIEEEKKTN